MLLGRSIADLPLPDWEFESQEITSGNEFL
jgi:hypothetical protein